MKWFVQNWAKIGGIVAILIIVYVLYNDLYLTKIESLFWLHFVTLLIHQFEEYVYPSGFKEFFNENIYNKNLIIRFPLNDKAIILVNVFLGWTAYLISAVNAEKSIQLAIGLLAVTILNGFLHSFMFVIKRKYNPGFVSGFFLLIPFGIYMMLRLANNISSDIMVSGFIVFVIGSAFIPLSIFITNRMKNT